MRDGLPHHTGTEGHGFAVSRARKNRMVARFINWSAVHNRSPGKGLSACSVPLPAGGRIQSVQVVAGRPGAGIKWRAPSNAFSKACGSYRSDVWLLLVNLDRDTASRWSGPSQAVERARRSTLCPSSTISSGRLFLNGLFASITRVCFTDKARIKLLLNWKEGSIMPPHSMQPLNSPPSARQRACRLS
jgi:hypothetical protein